MGLSRSSAAAGVVGGKIYVLGGCEKKDRDSSNWAEVFDPKTQTWEPLPPMPDRKMRFQYIHASVVVREEKVYAVDLMERIFYYSPSEGIWGRGNVAKLKGNRRDWCVLDRLIYSCDRYGNLCWSEIEQLEVVGQGQGPEGSMCWNKVQGSGSSLRTTLSCSKLVHFDQVLESVWESNKRRFGAQKKIIELLPGARLSNSGANNIVLFWDVINGDHLQIWCAEISLERRQGGAEVWGNMEWSHLVMTVDPFLHHYKEASESADIDWDNIRFGLKPTDYMYVMKCNLHSEFSNGELQRFGDIEVSPSAGVLNYGQVLFPSFLQKSWWHWRC